ncbi:MAG: ferritin-like domain-containing protein [Parvibaculaceae bacterium]
MPNASQKTLEDLFHDTLRDVYYAEKKLTKTLPKLAKKASSEDLAQAFTDHLAQTEQHVSRLENVFALIDKTPRGKTCPAMDGLVEEGSELMEEFEGGTLDVALIGAAQAVEHYEIARYGTLCAWAEQLGLTEAKDILGETLEEEKAADEKLTALSESVNAAAEKDDDREAAE